MALEAIITACVRIKDRTADCVVAQPGPSQAEGADDPVENGEFAERKPTAASMFTLITLNTAGSMPVARTAHLLCVREAKERRGSEGPERR